MILPTSTTTVALAIAAAWGVDAGLTQPNPNNPPSIRNIYTFPNNTFIENIAVRSNSRLLITSMSVPDLFSIDPTVSNPTASVIHTFTNITGIAGIAETAPDVFALVTATWDLANTRAIPGTLAVWTADFTGSLFGTQQQQAPVIKFLTQIPNSISINGLAAHPFNPRFLMGADSAIGAVWRIDLLTGQHQIAFSSPLFTPTGTEPGKHLGINGLRSSGRHLYFTNSAQGLFGRVAIDRNGNKVGEIEVISHSSDAGNAGDVVYDDIALDVLNKKAWIASHPDYAVQVDLVGGSQRLVNDTRKLLNPTSAAFGRGSLKERRTLYVTNGGEFVGFDLVNNGVVALDF
ncbi:hypothetical protein QBC43DRAFT_293844 [Cladorrhinum sp. PSN259]|nr:hypothetical protein QBC43DRAFT_293844 [Cladorrhinum sp. PSN259]